MKPTIIKTGGVVTLALLVALVTACSKSDQPEVQPSQPEVRPDQREVQNALEGARAAAQKTAEKAGDALARSWDEVADLTADRKDDLIAAMERGYSGLAEQARQLADKAGDAGGAAAKKFNEAGDAFQDLLKKAGDASAETWAATKEQLAKGWAQVTEAFEELRQKATPQ